MNDTAAARVAPELSEKQIGVHHDLAYIRPPRTAVLSSVHLRTVELLQQTQLEKPFKMFARLYILSTFALLAVATPWGEPPPVTVTVTSTAPASTVTTVSQCNTGSISCCNTVAQASFIYLFYIPSYTYLHSSVSIRLALRKLTSSPGSSTSSWALLPASSGSAAPQSASSVSEAAMDAQPTPFAARTTPSYVSCSSLPDICVLRRILFQGGLINIGCIPITL